MKLYLFSPVCLRGMHRDHVTLVFVATARLSINENNSFDTSLQCLQWCYVHVCAHSWMKQDSKNIIYFYFLCSYAQCWWPQLDPSKADDTINVRQDEQPVHALLLADTHLLGSRKGHWFDKLRR